MRMQRYKKKNKRRMKLTDFYHFLLLMSFPHYYKLQILFIEKFLRSSHISFLLCRWFITMLARVKPKIAVMWTSEPLI